MCGEPYAPGSGEAEGAPAECFEVEVDVCRPASACERFGEINSCSERPNCRWGIRSACDCDVPYDAEAPDDADRERRSAMPVQDCPEECYGCMPQRIPIECDELDYFACEESSDCYWSEEGGTHSSQNEDPGSDAMAPVAPHPSGNCMPQ